MSRKVSLKRRLYLLFASAPFIFQKWSIQKKLHVSLLTLIGILGFNACLTAYEAYRLKELNLNLSYLIYLDLVGIFCGGLFIWVLSKSVIRRMKKMVEQIENRSFVEPQNTYSADEIGELARAVSFMKKNHCNTGEILEEKNLLIQAILDHSVDSIFLFNSEGLITSYSRSFQEKFGYNDEEIEELNLSALIPSLQMHEVLGHFSEQTAMKKFYTRELFVCKNNQKKVPVKCSIFPIAKATSAVYVGIVRHSRKTERIKSFVTKYITKK